MQAYTMDSDWLCFHPSLGIPRFRPPAGAVDAHCHVFGPGRTFGFAPERKYTPCDASAFQLFALRDHLGFSRNVVVQATCHGSDNAAMVDALRQSGGRARGVATIRPDITDGELADLHAAGVRGVRFNYVRRLVDPQPDAYYHRIAARIAPYGWHIVIYFEPADLAERWDLFTSLDADLVVDHMGRPDVAQGTDSAAFEQFQRFMTDNPRIWCKVTCPERLTNTGPPDYDDVVPFARLLVDRFEDRVLWGTDWPHPNLKSHMPDDASLVDLIPRIATTEALRQKLLVGNPMRLYWPEEASA